LFRMVKKPKIFERWKQQYVNFQKFTVRFKAQLN
jgi:hypothetical protein